MNTIFFNLKIADMLTLCEELDEAYESFEGIKDDETAKVVFEELKELYKKALEVSTKDKETPVLLSEAKKNLSLSWSKLRRVIDGYEANALEPLSKAGGVLKSIYEKSIQEEGDKIECFRSLITDFEDEIDSLMGMRESMERVFIAHDEVKRLHKEIEEQSALLKDKPNATELKKQLIAVINIKLLPYLRIMADMKPDVFSLYYRVVSKSISRANASVTPRNAHKKGEIRLCKEEEIHAVGSFFDRVVKRLDSEGKNFPLWEYGKYPSLQTAKDAAKDNALYVCVDEWKNGEKIVAAFILDNHPIGKTEKAAWSISLQEGEYALIHALAVAPEAHGRKLGKKIVEFCKEEAKAKGFKAIRLDVVPNNMSAKRIYEEAGFRFVGDYDLELEDERLNPLSLYEYNF